MAVEGRVSHRLNQEKWYRACFVVDMAVREKEREVKNLLVGRRIVEEGEVEYSVAESRG